MLSDRRLWTERARGSRFARCGQFFFIEGANTASSRLQAEWRFQVDCRMAVLLLAVGVFAGCHWGRYQPPAPHDFDAETTIPADIDAVWNAVIDVLGERDWAIDRVERADGFISTNWMSAGWLTPAPHVGYLDCGGEMSVGKPVRASAHEGRFNVVVRESDDSVVLKINSVWRAYRDAERVDCLSTGLIEEELHAEVRTRAASS